jgi:lipopolysaccharide export system permease protein
MNIKRMDRLIVAEVAPMFVFGVLLFTSVFFAAGEMLRLAQFTTLGVPLATVGELILLTLPYIVAMTFPMAMLLAALLGFGRLSSDSEIVALVAAGVRFERIVAPLALFALLVSLVGLWFADAVVPYANRERERVYKKIGETATGGPGGGGASGFSVPLRDKKTGELQMVVQVEGGVDLIRQELRNVGIEVWKNNRQVGFVFAQRAKWKVGTRDWTLDDFYLTSWEDMESPYVLSSAGGQIRENSLLGPDNTLKGAGTPDEMNKRKAGVAETSIRALRDVIRAQRALGDVSGAREAEVEIARRIALPFASFVFALVGAPLGVRPARSGGKGVGFGLAILIIFAYWVSFQITLLLGRSGPLPPVVAAALPNLAGVVAAVYLNRRVLR